MELYQASPSAWAAPRLHWVTGTFLLLMNNRPGICKEQGTGDSSFLSFFLSRVGNHVRPSLLTATKIISVDLRLCLFRSLSTAQTSVSCTPPMRQKIWIFLSESQVYALLKVQRCLDANTKRLMCPSWILLIHFLRCLTADMHQKCRPCACRLP